MNGPGPLYPIVDVHDDGDDSGRALALARALIAAGIEVLQIRAKRLSSGAFADLVREAVMAGPDCRIIVNDRADVALAAGAAGVHLGDQDLPVQSARRLLGPGHIVGLSTHSIEEIEAAQGLPVDYLGFGPVFESPTKPGLRRPRGTELLAEACRRSRIPVVAIGGMGLERAAGVLRAGAASVAVISELERAADPAALADDYRRLQAVSSLS